MYIVWIYNKRLSFQNCLKIGCKISYSVKKNSALKGLNEELREHLSGKNYKMFKFFQIFLTVFNKLSKLRVIRTFNCVSAFRILLVIQ